MLRNIVTISITLMTSLFLANITLGYVGESVSFENGVTVEVTMATNPFQWKEGLMNMDYLRENTGMLFIFEADDRHAFWMRNMSFAIDIIWIDSSLKVVDITREALPCREKLCPSYSSSVPAKYVLEVPAGFAKKNLIKIGSKVVF
jgi:uncharacterized membrane protein (UPF0127 family)